ncbi:hypothetical protein H257_17430 [Aphanomyces astaci]|uniref:DDE-1 domain-containing protein n=1 Tax=Aphanomyces astaci TaxID=112090 RepID=W4FGX7_APHAT|nr:hypothetical protein H257_17430 [Aphanomyces astaci]ETV66013.1 hypothetical protein H257_17430 [Aphanomyces astaci]|eukprot:XP_009844532.1 hypothetical protein H257_17430 [Aphanomyces astaci]
MAKFFGGPAFSPVHCDKLPILFVLKGKPGGDIERKEIPTFPSLHLYLVQENAWVDKEVWNIYLNDLL